jgi:hypothetical protein
MCSAMSSMHVAAKGDNAARKQMIACQLDKMHDDQLCKFGAIVNAADFHAQMKPESNYVNGFYLEDAERLKKLCTEDPQYGDKIRQALCESLVARPHLDRTLLEFVKREVDTPECVKAPPRSPPGIAKPRSLFQD